MAASANVIQFPGSHEKITCHVRVPNVSEVLRGCSDVPSGISHAAVAMQHVAERFDDLALLFEECPEAKMISGTHFIDGHYTIVFEIPRRYRHELLEMGWDPAEVDVEAAVE